MMYGILVMSIVYVLEDKWFKSAFCFAVLLNFKHIFLYSAPAYGLYYIRQAVVQRKSFYNFIVLAVQTIAVFVCSFYPVVRSRPLEIT
jgi:alpha-1,3-glucosyltransferase